MISKDTLRVCICATLEILAKLSRNIRLGEEEINPSKRKDDIKITINTKKGSRKGD